MQLQSQGAGHIGSYFRNEWGGLIYFRVGEEVFASLHSGWQEEPVWKVGERWFHKGRELPYAPEGDEDEHR